MKVSTSLAMLFGAALGTTVGCATTESSQAQPQAGTEATASQTTPPKFKAHKYKCKWEKPVGSNILRKVCRSEEQIERDRTSGQESIDRMRPQGNKGLN